MTGLWGPGGDLSFCRPCRGSEVHLALHTGGLRTLAIVLSPARGSACAQELLDEGLVRCAHRTLAIVLAPTRGSACAQELLDEGLVRCAHRTLAIVLSPLEGLLPALRDCLRSGTALRGVHVPTLSVWASARLSQVALTARLTHSYTALRRSRVWRRASNPRICPCRSRGGVPRPA